MKKYLKYVLKNKQNGGIKNEILIQNNIGDDIVIYRGVLNFKIEFTNMSQNKLKQCSATILGHNELPYIETGYIVKSNPSKLNDFYCLYDCGTGFLSVVGDFGDKKPKQTKNIPIYKTYEEFISNIPPLEKLNTFNQQLPGTRKYNEIVIKEISLDDIIFFCFVICDRNGQLVDLHQKFMNIALVQNNIFTETQKIIPIVEYKPTQNKFVVLTEKLVDLTIFNNIELNELKIEPLWIIRKKISDNFYKFANHNKKRLLSQLKQHFLHNPDRNELGIIKIFLNDDELRELSEVQYEPNYNSPYVEKLKDMLNIRE